MQKLTTWWMKTLTQNEKQLRQQNNTADWKTDLLPGFTAEYNVNSSTTDTSIAENKMTLHKCQDARANPLLCEEQRPFSCATRTT